jgi:hypothetical protein
MCAQIYDKIQEGIHSNVTTINGYEETFSHVVSVAASLCRHKGPPEAAGPCDRLQVNPIARRTGDIHLQTGQTVSSGRHVIDSLEYGLRGCGAAYEESSGRVQMFRRNLLSPSSKCKHNLVMKAVDKSKSPCPSATIHGATFQEKIFLRT